MLSVQILKVLSMLHVRWFMCSTFLPLQHFKGLLLKSGFSSTIFFWLQALSWTLYSCFFKNKNYNVFWSYEDLEDIIVIVPRTKGAWNSRSRSHISSRSWKTWKWRCSWTITMNRYSSQKAMEIHVTLQCEKIPIWNLPTHEIHQYLRSHISSENQTLRK